MPNLGFTRRLAALGLAGTLAASAAACARNPVTGQRELSFISESQEIQMGRESAQQVAASIGLVENQALQDYVQRIGLALASDSERPNLPWTFRVVDDPTPNAFALPGGFIFVTRGMLSVMNSEAELASVLGHEIGHVTARHSVNQMSQQQLAQIGLVAGAIFAPEAAASFGDLAGAGLQMLFLKYGRDDERQADELGFKYALSENYDVREMTDMFEALRRLGEGSGQSPLPSWMSTHPYPEERIESTKARLAALQQPLTNTVSNQQQYMQHVTGLVYGENPRNGYFRGNAFIHPDLKFRLDFPSGWRMQNTPQAVVGVSAQQDAALQLTLAKAADPATATRTFLGQQGIQAGQSFQQTINGIPAAGSYFQAQTEQGVIQGMVAYFNYGGNSYQLLGYSPTARFAANEPAIRSVVNSFQPVTDAALLNVQPQKMSAVRLDRAMTLSAFNQRYPSVIPIAELALINGVADGNTQIAAGTYVKRVTQ